MAVIKHLQDSSCKDYNATTIIDEEVKWPESKTPWMDGRVMTPYGNVEIFVCAETSERRANRAKNVQAALGCEPPVWDWLVIANMAIDGRRYTRKWLYLDDRPTKRGLAILMRRYAKELTQGTRGTKHGAHRKA